MRLRRLRRPDVGPGFVVGYGIDCAEQYRGLRDIRALAEAEPQARRR
jgi:hypoxanthine-guanine phosphoribosyltransferase